MKNKDTIPFYLHDIKKEEINHIIEVLHSPWINTGPKVDEFSNNLKKYLSTSHCQLTNSATSALFMALKVFGIKPGDEIITSSYTFCATTNVVLQLGATPILCDIKDDFTLDPKEIEKKITPKTKAIIPVDYGGALCDYETIFQIVNNKKHLFNPCNSYQSSLNRPLILADAAHSLGSFFTNKAHRIPSGIIADLTAFSFHVVKNITTIDGGSLTSSQDSLLDLNHFFKELKEISLHGMNKTALDRSKGIGYDYDVSHIGYKFNMNDVSAAMGISQLKKLSSFIKKRKYLAKIYDEELKNTPVQLWSYNKNKVDNSYHLYPILLKDLNTRDLVYKELKDKYHIHCNVHFKPIPLLSLYKNMNYNINDTPKSLFMYERQLSLPLYTKLEKEDIIYICNSIKKVLESL